MIGKGYVIEHCVSLFNKRQKERLFREYVTDTLKLINDNLANKLGGSIIETKYSELIKPNKKPEKTAEEIVLDVMKRAGLTIG